MCNWKRPLTGKLRCTSTCNAKHSPTKKLKRTSKRTRGLVFLLFGLFSFLLAGALACYNWQQNYLAQQAAARTLAALQETLATENITNQEGEIGNHASTGSTNAPAPSPQGEAEPPEPTEPEYLGVLSLPSIARELPIATNWSMAALTETPCRHFGSVASEDLVIAGHNYPSHFGKLARLAVGDEITLTTLEGSIHRYTVAVVKAVAASDGAAVRDSGFPLVLYTCTPSGAARVAVFCQICYTENDK